jgi:hypothetical protein
MAYQDDPVITICILSRQHDNEDQSSVCIGLQIFKPVAEARQFNYPLLNVMGQVLGKTADDVFDYSQNDISYEISTLPFGGR